MSEGYRIHQVLSYHIIIYSPYNPALDSNLSGVSIHYFAKSYRKMAGSFIFFFSHFSPQISNSIKKIIVFI